MAEGDASHRVVLPEEALRAVLLHLRRTLEVSQARLSRAAGLSPATVAKLEKGERGLTQESLERLARAVGLTGEQFVDAVMRWQSARESDDAEAIGALAAEVDERIDPQRVAAADSRPVFSAADSAPADGFLDQQVSHSIEPAVLRQVLAGVLPDLVRADTRRLLRLEPVLLRTMRTATDDLALLRSLMDLVDAPGLRMLDEQDRQRAVAVVADDVARDREPVRVAAYPTGRVGHLFAHAVAHDGEHHWIDPQSRAYASGLDAADPRFERLEDGRVRLDISRVGGDVTWQEPDPQRHVLRAVLVGEPPHDLDQLADVYASTIIEFDWDGRPLTLVPRPDGEVEGSLPDGASVVHVLTAQNPRSRLTLSAENAERDRMLAHQLRAEGWTIHRATGRSPDRSWSEDGWAIVDAPLDRVLALARESEQNAIFEWTPQSRSVVWSDHDRRDVHGWAVTSD